MHLDACTKDKIDTINKKRKSDQLNLHQRVNMQEQTFYDLVQQVGASKYVCMRIFASACMYWYMRVVIISK